jgi:DoxX-like family
VDSIFAISDFNIAYIQNQDVLDRHLGPQNSIRSNPYGTNEATLESSERRRNVNLLVWIVQALLAVFCALNGVILISPPEPMKVVFDALPFSRGFMVGIGVLQVLGAIGLILPWALKIQPRLTPLAAAGLTIIMIGAIVTHLMRGEVAQAIPALIITLLAAFVVYARTVLVP